MERKLSDIIPSHGANTTDTDFKSELVAALLLEAGYSHHQIQLVRKGGNKRGYSKDIAHLSLNHYNQFSEELVLDIETNRSSIYDMLPENLFHKTTCKAQTKTKEQFLEEINRHRQEEFFVRRFFRVFEEECDRAKVLAQSWELRYDRKSSHQVFVNTFRQFWPIIGLMDLSRALRLLRMVPFISVIRQSRDEVANVLSFILQIPVNLTLVQHNHDVQEALQEARLGSMVLGLNFVTHGKLTDGDNNYELKLGPAPMAQLSDFFPECNWHRVLMGLIDMLLPAGANVNLIFKPSPDENFFMLGSHSSAISCLGINSTLMTN